MLFHEVKRRADAPFANGHSGIFLYLFITLCFGLTFVPASVDAATNVSGSITVNTTWSKANSPYIVSGNLTVNSGATLTIQPGVDVKFDGDYYFNVKGSLNAQGTSAERIRFTSNKATPAPDDWDGLFLGGPGNSLKYITIEYSNYAAFLSFADVTFDQSLIQYTWQGIYIGNNSRLVFSNSEIRNNTGSGITLSDSSVAAQITNNLITNNGGGVAVRYSTSSTAPAAIINNNRIYGNIDYNLWQSGPEYRKVANAGSNWWGSADPAVVMQGIKGSSITRAEINPILDGPNGNPITSFQILFGGYDSSLLLDNPQKSYYIFGYMKIGPAATLRVLPGVKIYFADGSNLDVFGSVDMQGTPDKRIELLPAGAIKATSATRWNAMVFNDSSDDSRSVISYCDIWNPYYGLETHSASPAFHHNRIFYPYMAFYIRGRNVSDLRWNLIVNPVSDVMELIDENGGFPQPLFRDNFIYGAGTLIQLFSSSAAFAPLVINAENNWWGTTDGSVIESRMRHKPASSNNPLIDYQPFRTAPNLVSSISPTKKFIDASRGETTAISFTLAQESYVSVVLYDWLKDNRIVRRLMTNVRQAAGARQVVWNGLDDQGQHLADGVYTFEVMAQSVSSSISDRYFPPYVKGSVEVLASSSLTQSVIKPYEGQGLEIRYDLLEPAVVTLMIGEAYNKFDKVATPILRQPRKATGNVYFWDGRNKDGAIAKSNDQEVYMITETLPVNGISIVTEPSIVPIGVIKADPKAFNPMYGQKTKIYYTLTATVKATVQIVTPDGIAIRKLVDQQTLSAGQQSVDWDGKDSQGRLARSDRDYRIRVTTVVGTQTIVNEGTVGVYR